MKEYEPKEYARLMHAISSSGSELAVSVAGFGKSKRASTGGPSAAGIARPAFLRTASADSGGFSDGKVSAASRATAPRTSSARSLGRGGRGTRKRGRKSNARRRRRKSVLEDDDGQSVFSRAGGRRLSVMGNVDVDAFLLMVVVDAWPIELHARALRRRHRAATQIAAFVRMARAKAALIRLRKEALRIPLRQLFRAHDTAGTGVLTYDQFRALLSDARRNIWPILLRLLICTRDR